MQANSRLLPSFPATGIYDRDLISTAQKEIAAIVGNRTDNSSTPDIEETEPHTKAWKAVQDAEATGDFETLCRVVIHQSRCAALNADSKAFWQACEQEARAARSLWREHQSCPRPWLLGRFDAANLIEWGDALRGVKPWTDFVY